MITTSQAWKDNQKKQIRAEGNIRLTFYKATSSGYAVDKVLTKSEIKSFNFSTRGTTANETLPYAVITFSIFKSLGVLDTSGYVKYDIGYYLNGAWEWITYGYFMVKETNIPENGLIANYRLISCFNIGSGTYPYKSVETTYKTGSYAFANYDIYSPNVFYRASTLIQELNAIYSGSDDNAHVSPLLPTVSYVELARQLGIVMGRTASISNGRFVFLNNVERTTIFSGIKKLNCLNKPEKYVEHYASSLSISVYPMNSDMPINVRSYDEIEVTNTSAGQKFYVESGKYGSYSSAGGGSGDVVDNQITISGSPSTYTVQLNPFNNQCKYEIVSLTPEVQISGNENETIYIDCKLLCYDRYEGVKPYLPYLEYAFNHNVFYEVECRIDPSFELFDLITIEMPDDTLIAGFVESIDYKYNGSFSGKIKIRKVDEIYTPLIFTIKGNGTFKYESNSTPQHNLEYTKGESLSWTAYTPGTDITVSENDVIAFRGVNPSGISKNISIRRGYFSCTVPVEIDGDIMSLIDKTGQTKTVPSEACFNELFSGLHIQKINPRVFSPTTLTNYAFYCLCGSNSNPYLQDYTEPIFWKVKQKNLLGGCFQRIFGGTYVPITLDLTDVEEIHTATSAGTAYGSLCVSSSVTGTTGDVNWTFIFGNELTSLDSNYYANGTPNTTNVKYLTLKFPKYLPADVPAFDVNNLIIEGSIKGSRTITVFADNKIIADSCQLKKGLYTTVNIYHNDGSSWEALSYVTLTSQDNCTLVFDDVPNAQHYELLRKVGSRYEVISQITSPTDLNSYFDSSGAFTTETIYVRAVTDDTSKLNSPNSSLQIYHGGGSATAYWFVITTAPTISVSSNILSISGAGGTPNKYFILVDNLLKLQTTSTSVDLTTLPNVSTGTHSIAVCAHYSESNYNYLGNKSNAVSWTKS